MVLHDIGDLLSITVSYLYQGVYESAHTVTVALRLTPTRQWTKLEGITSLMSVNKAKEKMKASYDEIRTLCRPLDALSQSSRRSG